MCERSLTRDPLWSETGEIWQPCVELRGSEWRRVSGEEQRRCATNRLSHTAGDIHTAVPMSSFKRINFFKAPPDPCLKQIC
ncbi:hypothetical protein PGIGA_G00154140 [Pangasianodon gigas]|uniref:Uncharacterized protein n=1 Tax=Pangasianodon gigas TaxID=30993 RepID=A0ACC5XPN5_PANGG|nr:hypothetical protein [Pangasianodon gigas]